MLRSIAFLTLLGAFAGTAVGQCDSQRDFTIQYDGQQVFAVNRDNKSCSCAAFESGKVRLFPQALPACTPSIAGTLQFTGTLLAFCDGTMWTYLSGPPPRILSLSTRIGPPSGGSIVFVIGSGFLADTEFRFGLALSPNVTVINSTLAIVVAPANTRGSKGAQPGKVFFLDDANFSGAEEVGLSSFMRRMSRCRRPAARTCFPVSDSCVFAPELSDSSEPHLTEVDNRVNIGGNDADNFHADDVNVEVVEDAAVINISPRMFSSARSPLTLPGQAHSKPG
eukprot:TRINITY_DN32799_c0_g1_i1.p1 TRINITY_DN32799_c0_g1~~TRINITY_DN32799_c0_g1_i1.p1  ORF type:complete len:280 (-),score=32.16 TRINITY_DN32799_c0_g1_i1:161-1000(-)